MMKRIKKIESLNYYLYLVIVLIAGAVFFSTSYFTTKKIVEVSNLNEVDKSFEVTNISNTGFDISVKSLSEVKVRYFIGSDPEMLNLFYETSSFVREDTTQYRSLLNGRTHYLQVEFEKADGSKIRSQIKEISK
jgi:hypothetical protein